MKRFWRLYKNHLIEFLLLATFSSPVNPALQFFSKIKSGAQ